MMERITKCPGEHANLRLLPLRPQCLPSPKVRLLPLAALTGLARALVQQGRLRPDRAEALARKATQSNTQFIDELVGIGEAIGLSSTAIARFAAETFGHPLFDLAAIDVISCRRTRSTRSWWPRCA